MEESTAYDVLPPNDAIEVIDRWRLTKPVPTGGKLTSGVVASVLENLSNGNYIEQSCMAAGIAPRTYHNWMERAEKDPDSVYAEFADLAQQARAAAEASNVRIIKRAAETTWTAAAWLLERQYPQRWGRRDRVHNTVDGTHTVQFVFTDKDHDTDKDSDSNAAETT